MVNRLAMDKSLAVQNLRLAGYSERRIAQTLEISRGAVRRHLAAVDANSTRAQTAPAQTGSDDPNSTKAQTGSGDPTAPSRPVASTSQCESFRQVIIEKLGWGAGA